MTSRVFTSPADAARDVAGVVRRVRPLGDAVLRGRLSPRERELVTVAVSRVNACSGCTFVHERWALRAGVGDDELRALELGDLSELDARGRAAVLYATARAESRFRGPVPDDVDAAARASLSPRELAAVDATARAMSVVNLSVSTAEALLARLPGSPPGTR